jgi:PhzF family phenazine biosynthesis protein
MQAVAGENNLSETAFLLRAGERWRIRWFTPKAEVALCGHATLASAWVVLHALGEGGGAVHFDSAGGPLSVRPEGSDLVLDFPAHPPGPATDPAAVARALGTAPVECLRTDANHLAVLESEAAVRAVAPDPGRVAALGGTGLIVTAPGVEADFVSRYFAPAVGVPEDPATGSAHCTLVPYWARRLGKAGLEARQLSARGGLLRCRDRVGRVDIGGRARLYLEGRITL